MARNTDFLNQAFCTVVTNGSVDVDHLSGDSIRVISNTEGSALDVGFDTATTVFSTDQSGTFEQDFAHTSPSLDKYIRLWKAQKTAAARKFSGQVITSANQSIRLEGCSISSIGQISTGGKTASAQTVVMNVEKIIYN